jgi:hypothetical protein
VFTTCGGTGQRLLFRCCLHKRIHLVCCGLPMSSAGQLLVCLAAGKQQLPLAWLLQVSVKSQHLRCLGVFAARVLSVWLHQ